jgi:L-ascorbate metabolism protein UlaG (beta-lactamase superfamily)
MSIDPAAPAYLAQDTKIEPLSCRWYAWPHLVSPVQQALNIAFRQVPILRSFIANPAVHTAAAKDPQFLCAPFIQTPEANRAAIEGLLKDCTMNCAALIEFAQDIVRFEREFRNGANGFSLDEWYRKVPASLAGLVELTYDSCNRPMLRLMEELLQLNGPDNEATQAIAFFRTRDADRGFFLNTPRLDSPDRLVVQVPFSSRAFDLISKSRIAPILVHELAKALIVPPTVQPRLAEYFSSSSPIRKQPAYEGDAVRIRYFGHACVLVQTSSVAVLTDPVVAWERDEQYGQLTFADLPDHIDYVFLTHNHQDHFVPEMFLQLRGRIGRILVPRNNPNNLADPSMKLTLQKLGFRNVDVLDALDTIPIPDGAITSVPFIGEHADLSIASKQGMHLHLKGRRFLFVADADCVDRLVYRRITSLLGEVDTLFIGMECHGAPLTWLYGPYLTTKISRKDDESRRLSGSDSDRAWAVVEEVGCRKAFVYAMGQEPWLKHLLGLQYSADSKQIVESDKFVDRCRSADIFAERLKGCREVIF